MMTLRGQGWRNPPDAMEKEGISTAAQNGLLAKLAPMYKEIMESGRAQ